MSEPNIFLSLMEKITKANKRKELCWMISSLTHLLIGISNVNNIQKSMSSYGVLSGINCIVNHQFYNSIIELSKLKIVRKHCWTNKKDFLVFVH